MTTPLSRMAALLSIFFACGASAAAGPFSSLVVFGDSLSDMGNLAQASVDIFPGRYYDNGRFSNGPVWVESLSVGLGLGELQSSTAGGGNFAYGGAKTTGTGGLPGLFIRDIDEQVSQFLNTRTIDPTGLFVVFAGSNDLLDVQFDVNAPVASLVEDIGRLIAAGAREFLVPNLPLLGLTPRFNSMPLEMAAYNLRTEQYNAALDAAVNSLAELNSSVTFFRLDVAALFTDAIANPTKYGLTNVTASAAPGLEPGAAVYDIGQVVPNPNEFLFWDDLHPTAAVHKILADRTLAMLDPKAGDFNADGLVTGDDLAAWRVSFGIDSGASVADGDADGDQRVDGVDFLVWQRRFTGGTSNAAVVPESATCLSIIVTFTALTAIRRRTAAVLATNGAAALNHWLR